MLGRIADSLYWMARYLERVDDTVRLIEWNLTDLVEVEEPVSAETHWGPLLGISGNGVGYAVVHADGRITEARVIHFLTRERANPNAVRACLRLARDNARIVRDHISKEMWEIVVGLWLRAEPHIVRPDEPQSTVQFCRAVRSDIAHLHGVTASTMMRGEAFEFHQLGTFLERADMTARIVDVAYRQLEPERPQNGRRRAALLESLSGLDAYRRTHGTDFGAADVAAFVVGEREFPRSLRFALDRLTQALEAVAGGAAASATARVVAALHGDVAAPGSTLGSSLHDDLMRFLAGIAELDATVRATLFQAGTECRCDT